MYGGVVVSGMVDLIGYYAPLPVGTEQVCLLYLGQDGMHVL